LQFLQLVLTAAGGRRRAGAVRYGRG
jgi:hypothetical protein